jgi:hypothetical protein
VAVLSIPAGPVIKRPVAMRGPWSPADVGGYLSVISSGGSQPLSVPLLGKEPLGEIQSFLKFAEPSVYVVERVA